MKPVDPILFAKNRAYQFVEEQQLALDEGHISESEWFENSNRFFTPIYLAAGDPRGQSGHSGDEARYRYTRMMILEAIHQSGSFLDVGCANGYLMESLHHWLQGSGLTLDFFGLDFSEELISLAQRRLPGWKDHFFLGNALEWTPPVLFKFVYLIGLDLVPTQRQESFLKRLLGQFVSEGGRLILGPVTEDKNHHELEQKLKSWGFHPDGYCMKSHQSYDQLVRILYWFDR
jgi:SAM-dependent methyltransferase